MKRIFALGTITLSAAGAIGLLAASSLKPVQAETFSSLTLIYTAVGVVDVDASPDVGTSVMCVNQSGRNATVRWRFVANNGAARGSETRTFPDGTMYGMGTVNNTGIYLTSAIVAQATNFIGRVLIYSTQSAVFCNAVVAYGFSVETGNSLPMVRFHPHPGTVE